MAQGNLTPVQRGSFMQLTDAEIREILKREKRKKKMRRKRIRAIVILVLILLVIIAVTVIKSRDKKPAETPVATRGIIFLDPGHGGDDPGSDNGTRLEKDDTLKVALAVRQKLWDLGFDVVMSRDSDTAVERTDRAKLANASGAKLMISFHRNQASSDGEGVEIYIPSDDSAESRMLAENILNALADQGFEKRSIRAGTLNDSKSDYDEIASLKMPACLVEVGFLSSSRDNALFDEQMDKNASAMADAISNTFKALYEKDAETPESGEDSGN